MSRTSWATSLQREYNHNYYIFRHDERYCRRFVSLTLAVGEFVLYAIVRIFERCACCLGSSSRRGPGHPNPSPSSSSSSSSPLGSHPRDRRNYGHHHQGGNNGQILRIAAEGAAAEAFRQLQWQQQQQQQIFGASLPTMVHHAPPLPHVRIARPGQVPGNPGPPQQTPHPVIPQTMFNPGGTGRFVISDDTTGRGFPQPMRGQVPGNPDARSVQSPVPNFSATAPLQAPKPGQVPGNPQLMETGIAARSQKTPRTPPPAPGAPRPVNLVPSNGSPVVYGRGNVVPGTPSSAGSTPNRPHQQGGFNQGVPGNPQGPFAQATPPPPYPAGRGRLPGQPGQPLG